MVSLEASKIAVDAHWVKVVLLLPQYLSHQTHWTPGPDRTSWACQVSKVVWTRVKETASAHAAKHLQIRWRRCSPLRQTGPGEACATSPTAWKWGPQLAALRRRPGRCVRTCQTVSKPPCCNILPLGRRRSRVVRFSPQRCMLSSTYLGPLMGPS